ncbi:MAG: dihydroorotate dehydrogenase electron transfer subunit [Ruminococcus sp.]|nr:dihydroorotate dehydrogenase electron transfer subunit [Ruminococcus sp.]
MSYLQTLAPILKKESLAANIYRFVLSCPSLVESAVPGQFIHILPPSLSLRRPISICEIDQKRGTLTIVFEVKGEGTRKLSELSVGNTMDVLGPLGNGFTLLPPEKHVILVGGGIGNPPMLSLAQIYRENAIAICGYRSAAAVTLQDAFRTTGAETILCTDDGTAGRRALVTEPLQELLSNGTYDMVYACGPRPMLKFVAKAAQKAHALCEVSIEERIGCGIGACLVCACQLEREGKTVMGHVCKDGPVFRAEEVVW